MKDTPRDPDHVLVFADLDPVLLCLPVCIPLDFLRRVGNSCPPRYPAWRCGRPKNTYLKEDRMRRPPDVGATSSADGR